MIRKVPEIHVDIQKRLQTFFNKCAGLFLFDQPVLGSDQGDVQRLNQLKLLIVVFMLNDESGNPLARRNHLTECVL